jgi:hypothetical protein
MSFIDAIKDAFYAMGNPEDAQLDAQVYPNDRLVQIFQRSFQNQPKLASCLKI